MADLVGDAPDGKTLIEQLEDLNKQLDEIRLKIQDPFAQGFLFSAQGQISCYLESATRRNYLHNDKTNNR